MASLTCGCGVGSNDVKCRWHAAQRPLTAGTSNLPMCGSCGSTIWPGNYHSCRPVENPKGWQCPVCGTVYAPTVPSCQNAHTPPPKATMGANDA